MSEGDNIEILMTALRWAKIQAKIAAGSSVSQAEIEADVEMNRIRADLEIAYPPSKAGKQQ